MRYVFFLLLALPSFGQTADTTRSRRASSTPAGNASLTNQEINQSLNQIATVNQNSAVRVFDSRYEGLRGTPYLLPAWSKGQVSLTNGRQLTDVSLKFDAARQALLLLRPQQNNDSIIIDRATVNHFRLVDAQGQEYLFRRYPTAKTTDADVAGGYFLVLYEGKSALLKRVNKTFDAADYKGAYNSGNRYDTYSDANSYYILKPDQTLTRVKLSKKALLDALSDKADALKTFADQRKLGLKSELDAAQLVQYYDGL